MLRVVYTNGQSFDTADHAEAWEAYDQGAGRVDLYMRAEDGTFVLHADGYDWEEAE